MKRGIIIVLLLIMSTASFAGGFQRKAVRKVDAPQTQTIRETLKSGQPAQKIKVIREVVHVYEEKPAPAQGLAVGFHGAVPTAIYNGGWYDAEIGYSSVDSDPQGLVKAGLSWADLKFGLAWIQDNGARIGGYVGREHYIGKNVSLTGDIYLLTSGENRTDILTAVIGGRLYLN
ncbi:MAG: hypothetical protein KAV87_02175 [Desulfobacteraceae bacterium]|nr:hypothetical protein [Desulfobacteraceae bacterium]